eukprot:GFYU01014202.1.p1 GENE.GFYU01014202.1~~GFYU01014202.1.p1  ORF type:complete len:342 (-),score=96.10 GFYU01014202.1:302-1198(-)
MAPANVGFIGTGNMGLPMCHNLLKAGHNLTVYTRTASKAAPLAEAGAKVAESVKDLCDSCDFIFTCLPDIATCVKIYTDEAEGLFSLAKGTVFVDHSTVDVQTSRMCHTKATESGNSFLDAPVSGGPEGATAGTLSIMVGGEESVFKRVEEILNAMGKTVLLMGPGGGGTTSKLINQLLVGIHSVAAGEAAIVARETGVDFDQLKYLMENSWGGSRILSRNFPMMKEKAFPNSGAPLRNLHKDLKCAQDLSAALNVSLPMTNKATELYQKAMDDGCNNHDISFAYQLVRDTQPQNSSQ